VSKRIRYFSTQSYLLAFLLRAFLKHIWSLSWYLQVFHLSKASINLKSSQNFLTQNEAMSLRSLNWYLPDLNVDMFTILISTSHINLPFFSLTPNLYQLTGSQAMIYFDDIIFHQFIFFILWSGQVTITYCIKSSNIIFEKTLFKCLFGVI